MKGLFVTGTDTGVGKTFVACVVVRAARAAGHRVFAFKPIETGCVNGGFGPDQEALAEAAGSVPCGTYRLAMPAAPLVAARAQGVEIDLDLVHRDLDVGGREADYAVVEGAGGWRVPITETTDTSHLARLTELPILVVAKAGLGTINHSALTVEAIRRDGLEPSGVVLSAGPAGQEFRSSNAAEIHRLTGVQVWSEVAALIADLFP